MSRNVAMAFASTVAAIHNCIASNSQIWLEKHRETIKLLIKLYMPSGSGIDAGVQFDEEKSHGDKLVFHTSYHHMNDGGFYDGWTEHTITVTPSFIGSMNIKISGRDRNQIKDYLHDVFSTALTEEINEDKLAHQMKQARCI